MFQIVKSLRKIEGLTGIRLMSAELEIIGILYNDGPISVQALMGKVRASPSGFHLIKKSMQDTGLIVGCRSAQDARVKLLDLSPDLRESLAAIHRDQTMSTAAPRELAQFAAQIARPVVSEFA